MSESEVTLVVGGREHRGWEEVTVNRSIEQVAGSFSLTLSDRWPGQPEARPVRTGEACSVLIDGNVVITGYVDIARPAFDEKTHTLTVEGRDATGQLVDCSAEYSTGQWSGVSLAQIVSDLAAPFGVTVRAETDIGEPFAAFSIQEGETVFEAIERACRMRGVLPVSDARGALVLSRANATPLDVVLEEGLNILRASAGGDWRDRFSRYTVKGQTQGSDTWHGPQAASPSGVALDDVVSARLHRPLIVLGEDQAAPSACEQRARWERSVRAGRSEVCELTVQGWFAGRELWTPNRRVPVVSPWLGISLEDEWLLAAVTFSRGASGTTSELRLMPPDAFKIEPSPPKKSASSWVS